MASTRSTLIGCVRLRDAGFNGPFRTEIKFCSFTPALPLHDLFVVQTAIGNVPLNIRVGGRKTKKFGVTARAKGFQVKWLCKGLVAYHGEKM